MADTQTHKTGGNGMIKFKRNCSGIYTAETEYYNVDLYNSYNGYWGATVTVGNYGDDNYSETIISDYTKRDLVKAITSHIKMAIGENSS